MNLNLFLCTIYDVQKITRDGLFKLRLHGHVVKYHTFGLLFLIMDIYIYYAQITINFIIYFVVWISCFLKYCILAPTLANNLLLKYCTSVIFTHT